MLALNAIAIELGELCNYIAVRLKPVNNDESSRNVPGAAAKGKTG